MNYVNASDVAAALGVSTDKVINAMIQLLPDENFRKHCGRFDYDYSLRNLSLHWRAICKLRNKLSEGQPADVKREYDEFTIELIKYHWPAAPVEVRKPAKKTKGCCGL